MNVFSFEKKLISNVQNDDEFYDDYDYSILTVCDVNSQLFQWLQTIDCHDKYYVINFQSTAMCDCILQELTNNFVLLSRIRCTNATFRINFSGNNLSVSCASVY